jgi:nucleoside-diphosphate-sugar epimerase
MQEGSLRFATETAAVRGSGIVFITVGTLSRADGDADVSSSRGPRMCPDEGRVIPTFLSRALRGGRSRSAGMRGRRGVSVYAQDLTDGTSRLMRSDVHDLVNLGNTEEVRVIDVAHLILKLTGSRSRVVHTLRPQDDPVRRCPDITRARTLLGWEPTVPLRDGLALEWFAGRVRQQV